MSNDNKSTEEASTSRGRVTNPDVVRHALSLKEKNGRKGSSRNTSNGSARQKSPEHSSGSGTLVKESKTRQSKGNGTSSPRLERGEEAARTSTDVHSESSPKNGLRKKTNKKSDKQGKSSMSLKANQKADEVQQMLYPDMFGGDGQPRKAAVVSTPPSAKPIVPGAHFSGSSFHTSPPPSSFPRPSFGHSPQPPTAPVAAAQAHPVGHPSILPHPVGQVPSEYYTGNAGIRPMGGYPVPGVYPVQYQPYPQYAGAVNPHMPYYPPAFPHPGAASWHPYPAGSAFYGAVGHPGNAPPHDFAVQKSR